VDQPQTPPPVPLLRRQLMPLQRRPLLRILPMLQLWRRRRVVRPRRCQQAQHRVDATKLHFESHNSISTILVNSSSVKASSFAASICTRRRGTGDATPPPPHQARTDTHMHFLALEDVDESQLLLERRQQVHLLALDLPKLPHGLLPRLPLLLRSRLESLNLRTRNAARVPRVHNGRQPHGSAIVPRPTPVAVACPA
jgi:hypothetical protein